MSKIDKARKIKAKRDARIAGRDRTAGVPRHRCGKIVQPTPRERIEDVQAVGKSNPERRWASDPASRFLGWGSFGILVYGKMIDGPQLRAAENYAKLRDRWLWACAAARETPKAMDAGQEYQARPLWISAADPEDVLQSIIDTTRAWNDCLHVLEECGASLHGWSDRKRTKEALRAAVVDGVVHDVGELRSALNALANFWVYRKPVFDRG